MSLHSLYFQTFERILTGLTTISDPMVVHMATHLLPLFKLLEQKAYTDHFPALDRERSGLPILPEIIKIHQEIANATPPKRSVDTIRANLLDEMLIKRRLPNDKLLQNIEQSLYATMLMEKGTLFQGEPNDLDPMTDGSFLRLSWDFWDGATATPIFCRAWLHEQIRAPIDEELIRSLGRRFSGSGYTPLAMAIEFDDAIEDLRLKHLRKLTFGPFLSPIFSSAGSLFSPLLQDMADDRANWMLFWQIDEVISSGTENKREGFFRSKRPRERFLTDTSDATLIKRGASTTRQHLLMPPPIYQKIADCSPDNAITTALHHTRKHVLATDDKLIENI